MGGSFGVLILRAVREFKTVRIAYKIIKGNRLCLYKKKCRLQELNQGHKDFQSFALPTELKRHNVLVFYIK